MLPLRIAVDHLQPSPPIASSLHRMLIPFVHIRHRSMALACHPGLGPLSRPFAFKGATTAVIFVTVAVRKNAFWNASFLATRLATVEGPVHRDPLLLNTRIFTGVTFANQNAIRIKEVTFAHQMLFASRGLPSPREWDLAPWRSPSSKRMEFASRGSPSPKRIGFASHPYTAMEFGSRESHSRQRIHLASRGTPFPK